MKQRAIDLFTELGLRPVTYRTMSGHTGVRVMFRFEGLDMYLDARTRSDSYFEFYLNSNRLPVTTFGEFADVVRVIVKSSP